MCGRIVTPSEREVIGYAASLLGDGAVKDYNYNVGLTVPSERIPLIRELRDGGEQTLELRSAQWGFSGDEIYNARLETINDKKMWQTKFRYARAIVPVTRFYEGEAAFTTGAEVFGLGAVYDNAGYNTFAAVVTLPASPAVAAHHGRMPLVITTENVKRWLSSDEWDPADLLNQTPVEVHVHGDSQSGVHSG